MTFQAETGALLDRARKYERQGRAAEAAAVFAKAAEAMEAHGDRMSAVAVRARQARALAAAGTTGEAQRLLDVLDRGAAALPAEVRAAWTPRPRTCSRRPGGRARPRGAPGRRCRRSGRCTTRSGPGPRACTRRGSSWRTPGRAGRSGRCASCWRRCRRAGTTTGRSPSCSRTPSGGPTGTTTSSSPTRAVPRGGGSPPPWPWGRTWPSATGSPGTPSPTAARATTGSCWSATGGSPTPRAGASRWTRCSTRRTATRPSRWCSTGAGAAPGARVARGDRRLVPRARHLRRDRPAGRGAVRPDPAVRGAVPADGLLPPDGRVESVYGYDFGRAVNMARWGLNAGYCDAEEAEKCVLTAGHRANQVYPSWGRSRRGTSSAGCCGSTRASSASGTSARSPPPHPLRGPRQPVAAHGLGLTAPPPVSRGRRCRR